MAAERGADSGRDRASDPARAVRRDGRGTASGAVLQADAARARSDRRAPLRRPARERRARGRGPCAPPRRRLPHRLGMGDRPALQRRRRGRRFRLRHRRRRGAVRPGPVPARMDAGRRHRRGQGPPGRRHRARPLAPRPAPRALALAVRQARRGRAPRLDRARRARRRRHPLGQVPPGGRDPHARGDPLRDLRDAALAGPPGEALAPRPDRRMARRARSTRTTATVSTAPSCSTRRTPWRTRRGRRATAARSHRRSRAARAYASRTRSPMRASPTCRPPAPPPSPASPMPAGSGFGPPARRRSRPAPSSSPRWRRAASRRSKSSRGT